MKYENFLTEVKECVAKLCPDNIVRIEKILKNNSYELDGLIIMREGAEAAPAIYLNGYFNDYISGCSIENIAEKIVEFDSKSRMDISIDVNEYGNFKIMRKRIVYKLINFEKNSTLLNKVPHRKYLDFAIVYLCVVKETNNSCATWVITNDFLKIWNVDEDELFETASENTCCEMPVVVKSMPEIIKELMQDTYKKEIQDYYDDNIDESSRMYVVTNIQKLFGACTILYPDVLNDFAVQHGNFYILPSSIHEVIFVPDDGKICPDELRNMVQEVNRTQVQVYEFLSDEVYYYNAQAKELRILNK